jgi:hydrogenase maturation protease
MVPGVAVIAVGNRSRGDDAIGPLLLDRLGAWLGATGRAADFELLEDFQLQIEHALDLAPRRLALFIDAGTGTRAPFEFGEIAEAVPGSGHSTHTLSPAAVLGVHRQVTGRSAPPAFVLCVRGERFELGEEPSASARSHVEAAWRCLQALCERPDAAHWRAAFSAARQRSSPRARG